MDLTRYAEGAYLNVAMFKRHVLRDRESIVLVIARVSLAMVFDMKARREIEKPLLHFTGIEKPLLPSADVLNTLDEMYGGIENADHVWPGKAAEWYLARLASGGSGIRCRPAPEGSGPKPLRLIGEHGAALVKQRLAELGSSVDCFLGWLKIHHHDRWTAIYGLELFDWPADAMASISDFVRAEGLSTKTDDSGGESDGC